MSTTVLTVALAPRRWIRRLVGWVPPRVRPLPTAPAWSPGRPGRQVDRTACGAAVLVALRSGVDPRYRAAVTGRFDAAQRAAQRGARWWWPRSLGTTPWGMARWLRAAGVGGTRVRLVDAADRADLAAAVGEVDAAVTAGWAVPLLVGSTVPRHWCLALPGTAWRVYEPSSGSVRDVPVDAVLGRRLRSLLGFDDLQAVLLP